MRISPPFSLRYLLALPVLVQGSVSLAQTPAPAADMGRVEITSGRDNDTQQRRESTASKIVIGREEIEKQGDATIGEVLKRMPGISIGGVPGRGGGVRMRGLSAGYTQILLDGQRVPPGFSIESLTPEMVEKIEIYRAPTAETGAQAIAGTINIITREGRKGMPSELKVGSSWQGGYYAPNASLVRYHDFERWSANYTLSFNQFAAPDHSESLLTRREIVDPNNIASVRDTTRQRVSSSSYGRDGVNATARLQFKGDPGESLTLMPFVGLSRGSTAGRVIVDQEVSGQSSLNDKASTQNDNHFAIARLNGQWRRKLSSDSNVEWKFNVGGWNSQTNYSQTALNNALLPTYAEESNIQDRSLSLGGKYTNVLGGGHQWVSGTEVETVRRNQVAVNNMSGFSGSADLHASSLRYAIYSQDEWQLNPKWSTHLGARYEGLTTQGNTVDGDVTNHNSVFTPLLHAMWRPDPKSRDQVRMSLTRSFRTPSMATLLARRTRVPVLDKDTSPTFADSMGNPNLKPEVATGVDVAIEHYLPQGGVLSASAFHRRVQNLIRSVTTKEGSRWVSSPQNISEAVTEGIELEAKFRLDQMVPDAIPIELRNNLSFYRSRVLSIMGPDNRLDQQPAMTANIGGDYRMRSRPFTVGGNINYNPGYTTRTSDVQWYTVSQKRVIDVYGLWRVDNNTSWRLTLSNLDPRYYNTNSFYNTTNFVENNSTRNQSWINAQIRLEKKL
jgi:iron complex outermembrane receptor protein